MRAAGAGRIAVAFVARACCHRHSRLRRLWHLGHLLRHLLLARALKLGSKLPPQNPEVRVKLARIGLILRKRRYLEALGVGGKVPVHHKTGVLHRSRLAQAPERQLNGADEPNVLLALAPFRVAARLEFDLVNQGLGEPQRAKFTGDVRRDVAPHPIFTKVSGVITPAFTIVRVRLTLIAVNVSVEVGAAVLADAVACEGRHEEISCGGFCVDKLSPYKT